MSHRINDQLRTITCVISFPRYALTGLILASVMYCALFPVDNLVLEVISELHDCALITAIYGSREKTLKPTIEQTYKTDFYAFVDRDDIQNRGAWIKDSTRYQYLPETRSPLDNGTLVNSVYLNKHPYNQYKYFKMQFHRLPQLKKYRYIFWLDSSFVLRSKYSVELIIRRLQKLRAPSIFFSSTYRKKVRTEGRAAMNDVRWKSTTLWGLPQPFQNVSRQVTDYFNSGFTDKYFGLIWLTGHFVMDMQHYQNKEFLDEWYLQTLNYTTQCQLSMPYAAWKLNYHPVLIKPGFAKCNPFTRYAGHRH